MKRKLSIIIVLALIMGCILSACGKQKTVTGTDTQGPDIVDFRLTGYTFLVPDSFNDTIGQVKSNGNYIYTDRGETEYGSGILESYMLYLCRTDEEVAEFKKFEESVAEEEELTEEQMAKADEFYNSLQIFMVYGLKEGKTIDDIAAVLFGDIDIDLFKDKVELGSLGDYTYYLVTIDYDKADEMGILPELPEDMMSEIKTLEEEVASHPEYFTLKNRAVDFKPAEPGSTISFETVDLDGNTVNSESFFAENDITMVNIWRTWCEPCKKEFPELKALADEYADKGVGIVTYCADARDEDLIAYAHKVMDEYGLKTLLWSESIEAALPFKVTPTTYFVDRQGRFLGYPVAGADVERYRSTIDSFLAGELSNE